MNVLSSVYNGPEDYSGFQRFNFPLDSFQKHAICSIDKGHNVLVTAFTGSGKTLVAEYAILKTLDRGKKIIYTSPIKSLSNQKFHEFKQKYTNTNASVGILTGDIKFNPFSNITIMTTEILRNMLYREDREDREAEHPQPGDSIDLEKDVDIVVFDEIHYINDIDRGKVWEECLIMLPKHIQLILLSATIDRAEEFAQWIFQIRNRPIDLIPTFKRYVPLRHYYYLHGASKEGETPLDAIAHKLVPLLDESGKFQVENYNKLVVVKRNYDKYVGKQNYGQVGMLNPLVTFLTERNLCPALFFVFSRKKCEQYAAAVTKSLITPQEQSLVEKTITQQLFKIRDCDKYTSLPQFHSLKSMLLKGVCVHHSGLIPIFKELIEMLFAQKLVKVLFATETFAVGVNMPTKTVLYTDLSKRDNSGYRMLLTNEYTQMSGRAGRRGIDDVGHVILLPNLFQEMPTSLEMERMMLGKSQHIQSKFTLDYQFVLKSRMDVAHESLLSRELENQIATIVGLIQALGDEPEFDGEKFDEYNNLKREPEFKLSKKAEKERNDKIMTIEKHPAFEKYKKWADWQLKYEKLQDELSYNQTYIEYYREKVSEILTDGGFLNNSQLTIKGIIASRVTECNPILLTETLVSGMFDKLSGPEIAAVLSVFVKNERSEENILLSKLSVPACIKSTINTMYPISDNYIEREARHQLYLNVDWSLSLGFIETTYQWANGEHRSDDKFEGDFVKAMLKLTSICQTLAMAAELLGKTSITTILKQIEPVLMRDIISVESLYILT